MRARLMTVLLYALVLCLVGLPGSPLHAEDAPDFHLDLDTGGHRAIVKDLAFSQDGELLVSASDDKTIRVWDWQSGVTLRTIRGYSGASNDGKDFAVAISPDGTTIAAGGFFGAGLGDAPPYGDVRLFDMSTGRMKTVLEGNELPVYAVAFSPDGSRLVAGGQDGFVRIWRASGAKPEWTAEREIDADATHIQRLAFVAGGARIAVATTDNGIRLFDAASAEEIALPDEAEALRDVSVDALAVSANGALFATGAEDGSVDVWNAADGTLTAAMPKVDFAIGALSFADESRLIISCGYRCGDSNRTFTWTIGSADPASVIHGGHDGTVHAGVVSPDGRLIATAGGTSHEIHIWDAATGAPVKVLKGAGEPVMAVGIRADGSEIAWGNGNPCPERIACPETMGVLSHSLALPTAARFFEPPQDLASNADPYGRAAHAAGGWSLAATKGGSGGLDNGKLEIAKDGVAGASIERDATDGYLHSAFTLIDGGKRLISGGNDGTLVEYASDTGNQSGEFRDGHTGEIHAIAAAESANLLITGSADQTLRLWNLTTRELIVSMIFAGKEWVVWMPQGYYYASDEGDKLIGWQVNQGRDKEARFVRAEQLKKSLWSPEMVRRAIILRSAAKAVAEMRPGVDKELNRLMLRKPPEFAARLADDQSGARDGFARIEISGVDDAATDVGQFAILSNSRNVSDVVSRSVTGQGGTTIIEVPVDAGENSIRITATDEFGYLTERSVVALSKTKKTAAKTGKLFVVVVGVEKYPFLPEACNGRSCDLRFPVDDASEILRALAAKTAPLFSSMESLVLLNGEALGETPEQQAAIDALVGANNILEPDADTIGDQVEDFLDRPGPDDTTILFVAGHGINVDEKYYFIPTDGRRQEPDKWKRSSLVDWADIQEAMERAKGVRFMLLDTCHAANAFNPRLEKDAADARIVVFSATAANNTALEMAELGHGVFTYSVLAGLRGAAKTSKDGVTLFGLADYVSRQIVELTSARQKPYYFISDVDNMLLAAP